MSLSIEKTIQDGITTLVLSGNLDTGTVGQLETMIKELIAEADPGIIFDMQGVTYVSSFGLRMLVYTSKAMRAHGDRFVMHSVQQDVMDILTLSGLSQLLKVAETQEQANSMLG